MKIKELFEMAVKEYYTDLYALIMFLVYEKKVLTFEDDKEKLNYYMQPKFQKKMNQYLIEYKRRMKIKYRPNLYEITTHKGKTIYVTAKSPEHARKQARKHLHEPIEIKLIPPNFELVQVNRKGERVYKKAKELSEKEGKVWNGMA